MSGNWHGWSSDHQLGGRLFVCPRNLSKLATNMFNAIKEFFIGVLFAVGVISAPIPNTTDQIPTPDPEVFIQANSSKETIDDVSAEIEIEEPSEIANSVSILKVAPTPVFIASEPEPAPTVLVEEEPTEVVEILNGQCGNAIGRVIEKPTKNLCVVGEPTVIIEEASIYSWTCSGVNGGKDSLTCKAQIITNGHCGTLSNTIVPTNYDKNNLCSLGTVSDLQTVGTQLQWSCAGVYGGKSTQCYATKALTQSDLQIQSPRVDGVCGNANNQTFDYKPSRSLCSSGSASEVTKNVSTYNWSCFGNNSGISVQCVANVYVAPTIVVPSQCVGLSGMALNLCIAQYSSIH
jgi:hypothetical protein